MNFDNSLRQLPASRQFGLRWVRTLKDLRFIFLILLVYFGLSPLTPRLSNASIDTYDDLAIGIPFENIGPVLNAGGVSVFFGCSAGLSVTGRFDDQFFSKNEPEIEGTATAEERFGTSLTAGDFNGDGYQDLAISVPYETVGGAANAGTVYVLYGGPTGLRASGSQVWRQENSIAGGLSEDGDVFGLALAAGDFNHDGFSDLAIGAPGKKVGASDTAGAVTVLYGSSSGLTSNGSQVWHQNVAGMEGVAEVNDYFGYSLTAGDFNGDGFVDLAIGVPYEAIGAVTDAGAVSIIYGSASGLTVTGNQLWYEDLLTLTSEASDFFGWALAAGDFNGDGRADLAIGSHGKNLGGSDRGAVTVMYGTAAGLSAVGRGYFRQNIALLGVEKDSDHFGQALAAGDFNKDGYADLAIGVPGDDISGVAGSGAVNVVYGSAVGLTAANNQLWHQNLLGGSAAEVDDNFGRVLTTGDFNGDGYADLAVGVPNKNVGASVDAGAIHIIFGSAAGLTATIHQYFTQSTVGVKPASEANDHFGSALAAGKFGKPAALIFLPLVLSN
jgi:hypothetical protein